MGAVTVAAELSNTGLVIEPEKELTGEEEEKTQGES
jgi:hypothetical protein